MANPTPDPLATHRPASPWPRRLLRFSGPPRALPLAWQIASRRGRSPEPGEPPPSIAAVVGNLEVDVDRLRAYRRLCGFDPDRFDPDRFHGAGVDASGPDLVIPLPHFFVSAFLAQVAVLADRAFPPSPLGMVHLRNRFERVRPVRASERLRLETRILDWRQVRTGWEVDVESIFRAVSESGPVADAAPFPSVARSLSTTLSRGGGTGADRAGARKRNAPETAEQWEEWNLPADLGRRYARVSGDRNPIHLWPVTARLLGYRRPICHGMYLVSRATASLERWAGRALTELEVRFQTPTYLPSRCRLYRLPPVDGRRPFEIWSADGTRPHLFGSHPESESERALDPAL